MNRIKNIYSAPEADLLVVRFEQNIMSGGQFGDSQQAGSILDIEDDIDL